MINLPKTRLPWLRLSRSFRFTALVGCMSLAATAATPRTSEAQVVAAGKAAWSFISTAITVVKTADGILSNAPTLSDQLRQAEANIIDEVRYWKGQELAAATADALRKYQDLIQNPGQTELNVQRIQFLVGASSSNDAGLVFTELESAITDPRNADMAYALVGPFNALAMAMAHAMALHDQLVPGDAPFSFWTWNAHMGRTLRANYALVGAVGYHCSAGLNPGLVFFENTPDLWSHFEFKSWSATRSILWEKKIANKGVRVGSALVEVFHAQRSGHHTRSLEVWFNPGTHQISYEYPRIDFLESFAQPYDFYINGVATARDDVYAKAKEAAEASIYDAWFSDENVSGSRALMSKFVHELNGGDEFWPFPGELANGERLHAWVPEPTCQEGRAFATWP